MHDGGAAQDNKSWVAMALYTSSDKVNEPVALAIGSFFRYTF